jgi:hypothetical protein
MDRRTIVEHLFQAEEHLALAERQVTRQHELIAQLERDGDDSAAGRALLAQFGEIVKVLLADRDRMAKELKAVRRKDHRQAQRPIRARSRGRFTLDRR